MNRAENEGVRQVHINEQLFVVLCQFGLNAAWVLLPLIPAVVIYLIFPNANAALNGPLGHLSMKVSGAFAAYIIVFLVTMPIVNIQNANIKTLFRPTWRIMGKIKVVGVDQKEIEYDENSKDKLSIRLQPNIVTQDGPTDFTVLVPEIDNKLPGLELGYKCIGVQGVNFNNPEIGMKFTRDNDAHQIRIDTPIVFKEQRYVSLIQPKDVGCTKPIEPVVETTAALPSGDQSTPKARPAARPGDAQ